jgi:heme-degrading monooxygenase HmoA
MISEIAVLNIRREKSMLFDQAFEKARVFIRLIEGYITQELQKCLELKNKYLVLVRWETLQNHGIGFRQSEGYDSRKIVLYGFYDPIPVAEHYKKVF